jgi:hypothetical protein
MPPALYLAALMVWFGDAASMAVGGSDESLYRTE